ncbi:MAG: hypothetical protein ACI93R_001720 [Flavobacteriales bacterium]|jgi:hypothetical protein
MLIVKRIVSKIKRLELVLFLALFCVYMGLLKSLLPEGVSQVFASQSIKWIGVLFLASIIFLILKLKNKSDVFKLNSFTGYSLRDFGLILLPMTPIAQYALSNQAMLDGKDTALLLVWYTSMTLVIAYILPSLLSPFLSKTATKLLGITFAFCFFSMPILSKEFDWLEKGDFLIQMSFLVAVFIALSLLHLNKSILNSVILVLFMSNTGSLLFTPSNPKTELLTENAFSLSAQNMLLKKKPNIYLLSFDAYVSNETMQKYGINNIRQENHLKSKGFKIYDGTYTTGAHTLPTISDLMNVSRVPYDRHYAAGGGLAPRVLKNHGYKTFGIFRDDYLFWRTNPTYDDFKPDGAQPLGFLSQSILSGRFTSERGFTGLTQPEFNKKLFSIFDAPPEQPKFLHSHIGWPGHSPFPLTCRDEKIEISEYKNRLKHANIAMKQYVDAIIKADQEAIVVIFGDHGPYLKGDCYMLDGYGIKHITREHIQDRLGAFLAIRWPDDKYKDYDKITLIQDIFPVLFAYLAEDKSMLEHKLKPVTMWNTDGEHIIHSTNPDIQKVTVVEAGVISIGKDKGKPLFEYKRNNVTKSYGVLR